MYYKFYIVLFVLSLTSLSAQDVSATQSGAPADAVWIGSTDATPYLAGSGFALRSGTDIRFEGEPVKGQPYSADVTTETIQTLSDGNRIRRKNTAVIYRDSEGRTRREETIAAMGPWTTREPQTMIFINDPVIGAHYILNPDGQSGHRIPTPKLADHIRLPSTEPAPEARNRYAQVGARGDISASGVAVIAGATPLGNIKPPDKEDLGTRSIEGMEAVGTKFTTILSAEQMGADRDIEITFERWHSPELGIDVLTIRNDPRSGETTYRLTNINRTEPLPNLFEPPPDFSINTNQGGDVRIRHEAIKLP